MNGKLCGKFLEGSLGERTPQASKFIRKSRENEERMEKKSSC